MTRRVLVTADAVGGVWTFALDLARALVSRRWHVSLAIVGPPPSGPQRAAARVVPLDSYECSGKLEWMDEPWSDVSDAGDWLLDLERRLAPDVVHLNGYCHGALPWRAPVLVTGHSCVLSWWRAVHGCDAPRAWDRYATAVARGLQAAALVTAPTRAMLAALEGCYGPLPRARVIPNGRSAPLGAAAAIDGGWNPSGSKEPLVLSAGRLWDAAKNVAALCEAAPSIAWPVHVAGDAGARPPRAPNVRWLGPLDPDDLAAWMRRASIYALPARYEPFGLSAVEAALAGCALVLGDIPSLREVWDDAAAYVAPGSPAALAAAVSRLIDDAEMRARMAERARARARLFTVDRMADAYEHAYGDAIAAAAVAAVPGGAA